MNLMQKSSEFALLDKKYYPNLKTCGDATKNEILNQARTTRLLKRKCLNLFAVFAMHERSRLNGKICTCTMFIFVQVVKIKTNTAVAPN